MFVLAELHASPVRQVSVWSSQSNGCSVAFPNDGSWPIVWVRRGARKPTEENSLDGPAAAFGAYFQRQRPANCRRSMIPASSHLNDCCIQKPAARPTHTTRPLRPVALPQLNGRCRAGCRRLGSTNGPFGRWEHAASGAPYLKQ